MPFALTPPLRHFHPEDADMVARLNDMASGGLLFSTWVKAAGDSGDPWEQGRLQQIDQMKSGWVMIVLDQGEGVEAVLMGQAHPDEPVATEGVDPIWVPLILSPKQKLCPDTCLCGSTMDQFHFQRGMRSRILFL